MAWQFLGDNTLYWQPDTRVQTFPSGLVLVQRSAICRNTYLTTARGSITVGAVLPCQSPSTVTVFQFPQAQEISEGNGFVRFDVSGYGKWGDGVKRDRFVNIFGSNELLQGSILCPASFIQRVVPFTQFFDFTSLLPTISPTTLSRLNGSVCTVSGGWSIRQQDIPASFGSYMEVEVDYFFRPSSTQC
jgi:hypothetical protein